MQSYLPMQNQAQKKRVSHSPKLRAEQHATAGDFEDPMLQFDKMGNQEENSSLFLGRTISQT
jgi:hypothetical protein